MPSPSTLVKTAAAALVAAYSLPPVYHQLTVFGFFRTARVTHASAEAEIVLVDDTVHCEDLHRHGGYLFTACEDDARTRFAWWPPLAIFDDPELGARARGSLHVIDERTLKSKRLAVPNFAGPLVTHGIDVIADPQQPGAVYIFAVNHLPHPAYLASVRTKTPLASGTPKARSQIDVFHHVLGTGEARWLRSARDPLVRTPNDILALSPTSLYVTNDHLHAEGLLRVVEEMVPGSRWTDTVHLQIDDMAADEDGSQGVTARVALTGLQNNNGLARGRNESQVVVGCAVTGILAVADVLPDRTLRVSEQVRMDSTIDNPVYFHDEYAGEGEGKDASGFVLGGLSRACDLAKTHRDEEATEPVIVWLVQPGSVDGKGGRAWTKRVIFEDDGSRVRTASAAALVGIDPAEEGGRKRAWLVVTGFLSTSMLAVKVDLD